MFVDARELDGSSPINADIIVIGAGAAGITLAMELASSGLYVVLLESGGYEIDPETQTLNDGQVVAHDAIDLAGSRLRYFGGTTNHWSGLCLPLDEIDFEKKNSISYSGWPISRNDLLPFYRMAHEYCDLGDFDYDSKTVLGLGQDDFIPFDGRVIETRCLRLSEPTFFGRKYKEPLRTKGKIRVYLWSNAVALQQNEQGNVVSAIVKTLKNTQFTVIGKAFVLTCGAIENARLLLASNDLVKPGIGNVSDQVGRYYMDHLHGSVGIVRLGDYRLPQIYTTVQKAPDGTPLMHMTKIADEEQRKRGLLNASFWWTPHEEDEAKRELAVASRAGIEGLKNTVKYAIGMSKPQTVLSQEFCTFINNANSMTSELTRSFNKGPPKTIILRFEAEQSPNPESRVTLTADRDELGMPRVQLAWKPTNGDFESLKAAALLFGREIGRLGMGRLRLENRDDQSYWGVGSSFHQMGTTRMASDASKGVVDADCKVFGTGNLFVAGASVFPTVGRANPTLTLVALAVRLAHHLKRNWNNFG